MHVITDLDLLNKKVVLRCDYNVPIDNGIIKDNSKIVKSIKTIEYLLKNNCRIVILSHFGRVKTIDDKKNNTLKPVAKELANLIGKKVTFINNPHSNKTKELVDKISLGEIILLENTRFTDLEDEKESENSDELAKYFASLGDVFINDAFASMHREHSSTAAICKYLPNAVGFGVIEEVRNLDVLINNTPHPFGVFMGGAKVDDKLPIIEELIKRADCLMVGGGIANSFLKAKGANVGNSIATDDPEILNRLKYLLNNYKDKIVLPVDFVLDDGIIYDVGIKSIDLFSRCINNCDLIFVNGTCGKYEDDRFHEGTKNLFKELYNSKKKVIIGGGDTAAAAKKFGYIGKFNYISSGGGATLEYIANKKLAAMDWMK